IDSHVKSIFFTKQSSMHSLWLPGGLAPPCRVISSGRKSLYERHTASVNAYSVKMANVQCNNSIRSLLGKKLLFSRRTNEDKLTTKQLGLSRPNVSIQQVSTKGGKSYIQELEIVAIAGCEVANVVCISIYHCHFIGFTVCFTVRFLH